MEELYPNTQVEQVNQHAEPDHVLVQGVHHFTNEYGEDIAHPIETQVKKRNNKIKSFFSTLREYYRRPQ